MDEMHEMFADSSAGVRGTVGPNGNVPGRLPDPGRPADADHLLRSVQDDLAQLDRTELVDQVQVYDRMHASLADALARTADIAAPVTPGPSSA